MFFKAVLAFFLLPGVFALLLPVFIGWTDPGHTFGSWTGIPPLLTGLMLLFSCVYEFYVAGKGTLAPWSPPKQLVRTGLYRYTRNPMYLSVLVIILGLFLLFHSWRLLIYLLMMGCIFHIRVTRNEERWLADQFGTEWRNYKTVVPRWLPRRKTPAH